MNGSGAPARTGDPLVNSQALYQLSYAELERTVGIEPTTRNLEGSGSANELRSHSGAETRDRTRMSRASTARKDYLCYLGNWRHRRDLHPRPEAYEAPELLLLHGAMNWYLWVEANHRLFRYERNALDR